MTQPRYIAEIFATSVRLRNLGDTRLPAVVAPSGRRRAGSDSVQG